MNCIFFEIHGSKLKPDPVSDTSQATKICEPHCVFFLCISKDALNSFLAVVVQLTKFGSMPVILGSFDVISPEVLQYGFGAGRICGAAVKRGAIFAEVRLAFEFTVSIAIGCRVA